MLTKGESKMNKIYKNSKNDTKTKKGKKKWIIIILLISALGISYFSSYKVYGFYSKLYIIYWCKYSPDDIIKIIDNKSIIKSNIKNVKDIRDLQIFIDMSLRAYPNNHEIMKSAGIAYIKADLIEKGLAMSVLAYEHGDITPSELYNISKMIYERKNYEDVISFIRSHENLKDLRLAGMLGTSLYFIEKYDEAIPELEYSLNTQDNDPEKLFFLAVCYIKTGKDLQALPYLERAYAYDKNNKKIIGELVALYGRIGQTKKASELVNSLSWRLQP
jgi:tetratricopeptide (TPR) repeat protein